MSLALIGVIPKVVPALLLIACVGLAGAVYQHDGADIAATICPTPGHRRNVFDSRVADGFRSRHGRHRGPDRTGDRWHPGNARGSGRLCDGAHCGAVATLRDIDASATIPQVEIQLLRSIPMFAALPAPSLEGVARTASAGRGVRGHCRDPRRGPAATPTTPLRMAN